MIKDAILAALLLHGSLTLREIKTKLFIRNIELSEEDLLKHIKELSLISEGMNSNEEVVYSAFNMVEDL